MCLNDHPPIMETQLMTVTSWVRLPSTASQSLHLGSPKALELHQEQAGEERPSPAQPLPDGSFQLVVSDKNIIIEIPFQIPESSLWLEEFNFHLKVNK